MTSNSARRLLEKTINNQIAASSSWSAPLIFPEVVFPGMPASCLNIDILEYMMVDPKFKDLKLYFPTSKYPVDNPSQPFTTDSWKTLKTDIGRCAFEACSCSLTSNGGSKEGSSVPSVARRDGNGNLLSHERIAVLQDPFLCRAIFHWFCCWHPNSFRCILLPLIQ